MYLEDNQPINNMLQLGLKVYQRCPETFFREYQNKCRSHDLFQGQDDITKEQAKLIKTEQQKVYEEGRY